MTTKQRKLVQTVVANGGSISGKEMRSIGYSKAAAKNPKKYVSSKTIQQQVQKALRLHDITIENAIAPIGKALKATKFNEFTGEITDDYTTQLKASDRALKLLRVGQQDEPPPKKPTKDLTKALQDNDEVELQRVVFRKTEDESKTVHNDPK